VGSLYKLGGLGLVLRGQQGYRRLYNALGIKVADRPSGVGRHNVRVEAEVTVRSPRQEIYRIWRNLENLPVFMDHLVKVVELDDLNSRWISRAPAGMVVTWDARIISDVENELIAWESMEGSGVDNAGSVHFEDAPDGATRIRVLLRYDPPADLLGALFARALGNDPQHQIEEDLQRFKRIMEVGSVVAARKKTASRVKLL